MEFEFVSATHMNLHELAQCCYELSWRESCMYGITFGIGIIDSVIKINVSALHDFVTGTEVVWD